jgi:hypothetical protein
VSTAFTGVDDPARRGLIERSSPAARPRGDNVFILYPTTPTDGAAWIPIAWVVLGLVGTVVQLAVTGKKR